MKVIPIKYGREPTHYKVESNLSTKQSHLLTTSKISTKQYLHSFVDATIRGVSMLIGLRALKSLNSTEKNTTEDDGRYF